MEAVVQLLSDLAVVRSGVVQMCGDLRIYSNFLFSLTFYHFGTKTRRSTKTHVIRLSAPQPGPCMCSGKFSVVRECTSKANGKTYAVKMITKKISEHDEVLKEIEIMRAVDEHPNVIHLIDVFEDAEHFNLVLELYVRYSCVLRLFILYLG